MTFSDGTVPPDRGISSSQAVNLNEVNGQMYPYAIMPASGAVATSTTNNAHGVLTGGAGYYMRPDYVLVGDGNGTDLRFLMSGSADEAIAMTGPGWVSVGQQTVSGSRIDISPIAWACTGCLQTGDEDHGSGSVIFVYNSTGRIW